jgi:serine/threonine-protein kinase
MRCLSCDAENEGSATTCVSCGTLVGTPTAVVVSVNLSAGALFHNRYEILGPLGQGGMGMVYKARDRTLDEVVAIKVLRPDFAQDPKMAERFRSEIKLARKVRHPNVCAIHDYGEDRGLLYISMELVEGTDLKRILRERGALPPAEAYAIALQVAEGLQAVHDAGIIHRDLKTPNIMVDAKGFARLMDFGIAKRQGGGGAATATGHVLGTPEYMSPEQAQGKRVDARADIYALGILIFELFTGHVPFRGDTPISTILKHINDAPPLDVARLPGELRPVLAKCLAKQPESRYPSARAVGEALAEARDPSRRQVPMPTEALEAPTLPQRRPQRRLQPWLLALPFMAVGAGVLLLRLAPRGTPTAAVPSTLIALATPPSMTLAAVPATLAPAQATLEPTPSPTLAPAATPRPSPRPTPAAVLKATPLVVATAAPTPVPATPAPPVPATTTPAAGQLQIAVRPWAEVFLDGRLLGTTPLDRIQLAAGQHVLKLRHPAFESLERTVSVKSGETTKLVVDLAAEGVAKRP